MNEWQKLSYELEELERMLKAGASDTPDDQRGWQGKPLTPKEKDKLAAQVMDCHGRINKFITKQLEKLRK